MRENPRMAEYLRQQYPPGTRLRLEGMEDPYHPVEPGTLGTVVAVDDGCNILMKWDNGRSLSLVPGVDRFSALPVETQLLKLYMPMTLDLYERNPWGDWDDDPSELDSREAVEYADKITAALLRERHPEEAERGLMTYYDRQDGVEKKVRSYVFTAEVRSGRLWGVVECRVAGTLTPAELKTLKEDITGQAADGFGEGFEQREIRDGDTTLYAHLWSSDDSWSLRTEQECFSPRLAEGLPEVCYSVLPSDGSLILIERGKAGYAVSDYDLHDPEQNRGMADLHNQKLGVTPAQEQAMVCGSLFGWNTPGADPQAYEQDTPQMGGMTFGYGLA